MSNAKFLLRFLVPIAVAVALLVGALAVLAVADAGAQATNVTEEEYVEEAPEPGDPYFEAAAEDGRWVSYENPRDEYRNPYLGEGSGKICVTLRNEAGEVIVGESVPNTTVTVPTGEEIEWHSHADPMTVRLPLTEHYERPLDADQFGTTEDLGQGDGYMDSHCIEIHGLPEDGGTVEYGEAQVEGEHADRIEVVGYVQQAHDTWDTDVDPIEDAEPYEEAGGGWTYRPNESHGQVVVVLQLDGDEASGGDGPDGDEASGDASEDDGTDGAESGDDGSDADDATGETGSSVVERMPGFGVAAAVVALALVALARRG
ncbi:PGF-CTERM sorting domain-containing protein [Salinilacihabitans rarus]|uniref:PGF-CTERM sorting domain-containing protein n=1 Tax=Salinilacihabitans rarus TaxID=2961596 RepID=UPI0020C8CD36|nr:PGF-CTERM sorting domain-containing protein [Salinilacihabitans rarus]